MENCEYPDIKKINDNYKKIISNYKNCTKNIKNISEDIKNLENIHQVYINSGDLSSLNYSVYVDDIKHQINITKLEYEYINQICSINIEKLYRDLFKLYNRIIKILLLIFRENKDIIIKIWKSSEKINFDSPDFKKFRKSIKLISDNARSNNPTTNDNKIFEEIKKQFYIDIIIYNDLEKTHTYNIEDIIVIYDNLNKRLEELILSRELIRINLVDIQSKTDKGILGQTFIMDLNGKCDRIKIDYIIMLKLLESTINMHLNLSDKYTNISQNIADEVSCGDDTTISEDMKKINKNVDNDSDVDIFLSKDGRLRHSSIDTT
jgi:hypothetical protein